MSIAEAPSRKGRRPLIPALLLGAFPLMAAASEADRFGGATQGPEGAERTGFFRVEKIGEVWWIITPDGHPFISKGVCHVSYGGDRSPKLGFSPYQRAVEKKYKGEADWARATVKRLRDWGFNTVGAWSSPSTFRQEMPYTVILNLGARAGADWLKGSMPDIFSEDFRKKIGAACAEGCASRRDDPFLLGYFTDNELSWMPDWRRKRHLLDEYLAQEPPGAGRNAAIAFIRKRHGRIEDLNRSWGASFSDWNAIRDLPGRSAALDRDRRDFIGEVAREYFSRSREAIRARDPNHLILGCRFAGHYTEELVREMAPYVDIVSFNHYAHTPPWQALRRLHDITKMPIILTEFSFKALDSGLPNTRGAGQPVKTQADRSRLFRAYVTELIAAPFMVGYHWFQHSDQPKEGRFDGENSNYGIVNGSDEAWSLLLEAMTEVNGSAEEIHARGGPAGKR